MMETNNSTQKKYRYEKYPKLSSSLFNYENSCRVTAYQFPYFFKIEEGTDKNWIIVGYTLNPPFTSNANRPIAIMHENTKTFERVWYHHDLDMFEEVKITKLINPNK